MGNLEPIDDKDLDLKNKFIGDAEKLAKSQEKPATARKVETLTFPEKAPERKEGAAEKEAAYSRILAKTKLAAAPVQNSNTVEADARQASAETGEEAKIERLIGIAMQKGVVHAVNVARQLEDNYALDEFHDRLLAESLHDALVEKGLIREL